MKHKNYILLIITFVIISCTILKEPNNWNQTENINTNFSTNGRLTVAKNNRAMYANFSMENNNKFNYIEINSPLGGTMAKICTDERQAILVDDKQKIYEAKSVDKLIKQISAYEIPLDKLPLWISGRYSSNSNYSIKNENLLQDGWTITRKTNKQIPVFLKLKKDDLIITMTFSDFNNDAKNTIFNCKQELNIAN